MRNLEVPPKSHYLSPLYVYFSSRDIREMTNSCNQQHDGSGDDSTSDDDSVSLLCNLNACLSRGAAEDMEVRDLESQVGSKDQEKEVEMEINQLKPPESGISSWTQSAAGCANSTSQLGDCKLETPETSCYGTVLLPP